MLGLLMWWIVLSQDHGGVVAALTVFFLASIYVGLAIATSQLVTFTKGPEDKTEASDSS